MKKRWPWHRSFVELLSFGTRGFNDWEERAAGRQVAAVRQDAEVG